MSGCDSIIRASPSRKTGWSSTLRIRIGLACSITVAPFRGNCNGLLVFPPKPRYKRQRSAGWVTQVSASALADPYFLLVDGVILRQPLVLQEFSGFLDMCLVGRLVSQEADVPPPPV